MSAAYIQIHFKLDFFMKANTMNREIRVLPREQSYLGPYCLQYRLPKNISKPEELMTKSWLAGQGFTVTHNLKTEIVRKVNFREEL